MKYLLLIPAVFVFVFTSCVKDRTQATVVATPVRGDTVIYYWNFNVEDSSIQTPDLALITGAKFNYYSAYIDYTDGTPINVQNGADSGSCLRVRNPSDSIIFRMPTTGYDSVTLSYAVRRSNNGASQNAISYTVDGVNYITTAIGNNVYDVDTLFGRKEFILTQDGAINNNPKFAVKIAFRGSPDPHTATSGNCRFDNFCLKGKTQ